VDFFSLTDRLGFLSKDASELIIGAGAIILVYHNITMIIKLFGSRHSEET
jgi:hypothetical protein